MKKILLVLAFAISSMFAHTALMSCFDNGDGSITCEGGFSDGSTAKGVKFHLIQGGKSVLEETFNEDSEVTFKKPNGDFEVQLDAGEGHKITIKSKDIAK
ncbi:hypothetical protein CSPB12327_05850 [Campylobacter sp. RM12327]|uniref:hypothetical protein n=1 Tax=Campylobacter sputorum TaxID=206 RepID=UPI000B77E4BB|nr:MULTISPECIES: hypothetical protein [Campylobacter]ASM40779.1 hypothetical protein CSPB_1614 [Campylobacter sputorum]MBE7357914.1 hypothetical protein [Campylobacter sp. RM11302]MBF6669659.1 hypothetical protein [Campylobacter sp. RM12327]MBF6674802.1 hypothetical protein [Campylobacter sp. RM13538]MBF6675760.1 hypothetical protein [Campylobacter sp. RM12321]